MNGTARVQAYLDGNAARLEAWRDERLSVEFARPERVRVPEVRGGEFPAARPDVGRLGKVVCRRNWRRGEALEEAVPWLLLLTLVLLHVVVTVVGLRLDREEPLPPGAMVQMQR